MNAITKQPAPVEVEAFVGQVITDLGAAVSDVLVNIGRKLGLYASMAEIGACASQEIANVTGVRERYVREWPNNQAAGGYVTYDPEAGTYLLPAAQAGYEQTKVRGRAKAEAVFTFATTACNMIRIPGPLADAAT